MWFYSCGNDIILGEDLIDNFEFVEEVRNAYCKHSIIVYTR